jgi:hypothetical protein
MWLLIILSRVRAFHHVYCFVRMLIEFFLLSGDWSNLCPIYDALTPGQL